jgi:hypothetical protein
MITEADIRRTAGPSEGRRRVVDGARASEFGLGVIGRVEAP